MFRKALFWCHLVAGSIAGVVILLMSVTGVLLMYERQIIAWGDRELRSTPPTEGTLRLPPEALTLKLRESEGRWPATLTMQSEPGAPAEASFSPARSLYVDAYSGRILGEGSKSIRAFFRSVTDWHRWLTMQGLQRPVGRAITGASNLAFFFILISGIYLWLPRKWKWQNTRSVLLFRGGLKGKARDFNWHNVIGIWCALPLLFIVMGGLVISYPWATNLVYRLTGSEPPPPAPAAANRPPESRRQTANDGPKREESSQVDIAGLNEAWSRAKQEVPGWQTITLRIPTSSKAPFDVTVAESHRGRPDKRHALTVDRTSGSIIKSENFNSYNPGRRVRAWLRFVHTGEALGVPGQTLAGIASAGGGVLVWTGLSLAWRRFRTWRAQSSIRT